MSVQFTQSPVLFQDLEGEQYNYAGITYREAAVASPLVEDGSGQGLGHPEVTRKFATKKMVRTQIPVFRATEEAVREALVIAPKKTWLAYGDAVISIKSAVSKTGIAVLERWTSLIPGKVVSEPVVKVNEETRNVSVAVECMEVQDGDAEKLRGFGKFRSNGGFLRNIEITNQATGELVFNPMQSLRDANGNFNQVEHVVGGEEYKTLNYVIGLVAEQMKEGVAVWDSRTGKWENEQELMQLVEKQAVKVTVKRGNYEESCYQMLKDLYSKHPDFSFNDDLREVTHKNVWAWVGNQVQIVEVPLTRTFMGKCPIFAEHIHYLGTEFPELYSVLLAEVRKNQQLVGAALAIAEGEIPGATDENPYGTCVVLDGQTIVSSGDKTTINLSKMEDGVAVIDEVVVAGEYDMQFISKLHRLLAKNGFTGVVIESSDKNGDPYPVPLSLDIFKLITGSSSHKAVRLFFQILQHLEASDEDRSYDNWEGHLYRLTRMLAGELEYVVADSNALLAKATKTTPIAFGCRAASTLDASVRKDEMHMCSAMLAFWGLEAGDLAVLGRVPVPGMGVFKITINEDVPFGTAVVNAAMKHAVEEGDVDGDQLLAVIFSKEGELRRPGANVPEVAGVAQD